MTRSTSTRILVLMSLHASLAFAAQPSRPPHPGELALGIRRLGTVGSVLYVAAHPDDENTRLLAWLVGAGGMRAGYLSLTRGDGGQNLIGTEQDTMLGLVRTHELLAARRIDGAEQLFTRARDLGYSKNFNETFRDWGGKDAVLADVVLAIRRFRPDVIINRFNTQPPNHGHHTASAILAEEAFAAAADPSRFPEQLRDGVTVWKADRLLLNVSTWNLKPGTDLSMHLKLDVGTYEPLIGRSWSELAAESRSQHKSQGFGVAAERGPLLEYFSPIAGTKPTGVLDGLELTWKRFPGTDTLRAALSEAAAKFQAGAPHQSIPALLKVRAELIKLPDSNVWKTYKLGELDALLAGCAGLYLEARAEAAAAAPGESVQVDVTALNRSPAAVKLVDVSIPGANPMSGVALAQHAPWKASSSVVVASSAPISTPYWLRTPPRGGTFTHSDEAPIGSPTGSPALTATFTVELGGQKLELSRPVQFMWADPVRGELWRDFEVTPAVTATLEQDVVMFPNGAARAVFVTVAAGKPKASGKVRLELPEGWKSVPAEAPFELAARGDELAVVFEVTPPRNASRVSFAVAVLDASGSRSSWRARSVSYGHIPLLTVRQPSVGELVPVTLTTKVKRIGYVPGPGDRVAESLSAVGYEVTLLPEARLATEKLDAYEAIVVGVRAFNANPALAQHRDRLLDYVNRGGRLVVQYNTNSRVGPLNAPLGPWPLEIGRDRVTDENAELTPLDKKEPLLARPNALGPDDFKGWVQERGLYFASKWDEKYRPVFAAADEGEVPLKGGLLVGKHGKGTFVYTGLAFFRQLPAGVPGAYRLFANLLAQ
jgi:LmbE family N-acetylglucosaminyl deacetylase